jgi:hypothetical protein
MPPHTSATSLSAHAYHAAGTGDFKYLIVDRGKLAGTSTQFCAVRRAASSGD